MLFISKGQDHVDHFCAVIRFANEMGLLTQLLGELNHLATYAMNPQEPEKIIHCELMKDFAPYSFRYVMTKGIRTPENYENPPMSFYMNGGLVYQGPESPNGGASPSLNVSLSTGIGWFSHT